MKSVSLITQHYLESDSKAGFHWLADAFWRNGWEVYFFTCYISWMSWLRGRRRFPREVMWRATREARQLNWVKERLASYVWFTPWHPANMRLTWLNELTRPWFREYGNLRLGRIEDRLREVDLFIFEPTPGLMLYERFRGINDRARYVYRVSDDLRLLKRHPLLLDVEKEISSQFDLVSAPSRYIFERFAHLPNAKLQYHGLNRDAYDVVTPNPYPQGRTNVIFVGSSRFDRQFLKIAADQFPDWLFHIIGPINKLPQAPNIQRYGEMRFRDTIPYVQHADISLHTLSYSPGAESFTDSLKVLQYTYCHLPIVAPDFLRMDRSNVFYYTPAEPHSIGAALFEAQRFSKEGRVVEDATKIRTWKELAAELAGREMR